ncbi:MAG: hypothetical protein ACK4HW_12950 [Roseinatronobacter sp.]
MVWGGHTALGELLKVRPREKSHDIVARAHIQHRHRRTIAERLCNRGAQTWQNCDALRCGQSD